MRKSVRDQLVWAEMVVLHVCFTVGVMFRKVSATYHATMIAANAAADPLDAMVTTTRSLSLFHVAHTSPLSAPSFTVIGERCKEASVLA
jgi:hypothetical protein